MNMLVGKSEYGKMGGIEKNKFHEREGYPNGRLGHNTETYLDDVTDYFRSLGITVNVVE